LEETFGETVGRQFDELLAGPACEGPPGSESELTGGLLTLANWEGTRFFCLPHLAQGGFRMPGHVAPLTATVPPATVQLWSRLRRIDTTETVSLGKCRLAVRVCDPATLESTVPAAELQELNWWLSKEGPIELPELFLLAERK
jgi:hypothetical protein